jgi:hypothetical protein
MKIALLNAAILTSFGTFKFSPVSFARARKISKNSQINSAIGHAATAVVLSDLLEVEIEMNRAEYKQDVGETALVFRLKSRIPEGKVLDRAEIEEVGYEFGLLRRLK